MEPEEKGTM